jgi:hypothetical protein
VAIAHLLPLVTPRSMSTSLTQAAEVLLRPDREPFGEGAEHPISLFHEDDPGGVRSGFGKSQTVTWLMGSLRAPASSTPGGPAPTTTNVPAAAASGDGIELEHLKLLEHVPADGGRFLQRSRDEGMLRDPRHPEVGCSGADGEHERVEGLQGSF